MVSICSLLLRTFAILVFFVHSSPTVATPCNPGARTCIYPRIDVQVKTATKYWRPGFVELSIRCFPSVRSPFLRIGIYASEGSGYYGDSVFEVSLSGKRYFDTTVFVYIPPNDSSKLMIDSDCFRLDTCSNGDVDTICSGKGFEFLVFVCSKDKYKIYRELIGLPRLFNEHGDYCQLEELVWKEFDVLPPLHSSDTSAVSR